MDIGPVIKQQRISLDLTLHDLSDQTGVSLSHLGRIERGERFPSAHVLKKIAKPLSFDEGELMAMAGYLSSRCDNTERSPMLPHYGLDPIVARILAEEPVETQRLVLGILLAVKPAAKSMRYEWQTHRST